MTNKSRFRWLKWFIVLLIVGVGAVVGYRHFFGKKESAPPYQIAAVTRGDLTQVVTATGQLNPVTNVTVGSQISGIIQKIYVDFNSPVKAGQVIAQLDSATFQAAVKQAEGELANAKANLELTRVEAERAAELLRNNLISRSEHDRVQAQFQQAQAQVMIREAALQRADVDLSRCTIYAPVDGIVISRNVDVGQTVAASLSAPTLFIIANDLTQMQINANVAEADVGGVEPEQEVDFTVDAFPYRRFRGEVTQVRNSPITVQNVVSYDTVISVSNPDMKLKPGMTANVSIIIAERANVLKIPNAALRFRPPETAIGAGTTNAVAGQSAAPAQRGGGGPGAGRRGGGRGGRGGDAGMRGGPERQMVRTVYLAPEKNDKNAALKAAQVTLGISDGVMTEVIDGLQEDDQIVTGLTVPNTPAAAARPANPFSGGGGRGMRRF